MHACSSHLSLSASVATIAKSAREKTIITLCVFYGFPFNLLFVSSICKRFTTTNYTTITNATCTATTTDYTDTIVTAAPTTTDYTDTVATAAAINVTTTSNNQQLHIKYTAFSQTVYTFSYPCQTSSCYG